MLLFIVAHAPRVAQETQGLFALRGLYRVVVIAVLQRSEPSLFGGLPIARS
jgi:hypothetical protein